MLTKILFAALLAPSSLAITPRRRALRRVDVPKATKKQKNAAPIEDVGFAHRYFSTAIDDSRFFFRALAVRGGGEEKPLFTPAQTLAKTMIRQLPASRHGEAGEAIAEAFLVEAKMQK